MEGGDNKGVFRRIRSLDGVLAAGIPGTRPLGLTLSNGSFLRSSISTQLVSYGKPSSSRITRTFDGLGT